MINTLFYKYVPIRSDLETLRSKHRSFCNRLGLRGKVLISDEGINGNLTGEETSINAYKEALTSDPRFDGITFNDGRTDTHNFNRMIVKLRDEIITTHHDPDKSLIADRAPHISPESFEERIDEDDVVIVDARNAYEYNDGRFEDAVHLDIETFSEFFDEAHQLDDHKDQTIVTYCTGGVRCEKASAHLNRHGFDDVYQLHGGILNYGATVGNDHWEGDCFVFDKRGSINIDPAEQGDDEARIASYEPYQEKKDSATNKY